jgi:hypothetical protein
MRVERWLAYGWVEAVEVASSRLFLAVLVLCMPAALGDVLEALHRMRGSERW